MKTLHIKKRISVFTLVTAVMLTASCGDGIVSVTANSDERIIPDSLYRTSPSYVNIFDGRYRLSADVFVKGNDFTVYEHYYSLNDYYQRDTLKTDKTLLKAVYDNGYIIFNKTIPTFKKKAYHVNIGPKYQYDIYVILDYAYIFTSSSVKLTENPWQENLNTYWGAPGEDKITTRFYLGENNKGYIRFLEGERDSTFNFHYYYTSDSTFFTEVFDTNGNPVHENYCFSIRENKLYLHRTDYGKSMHIDENY